MAKKKTDDAKQKEEELRNNPINVFQCGHADCQKVEAMPMDEFKKHLLEAHQIQGDQIKGTKQMTMHMDGDYWFSSQYKWTLESGFEFHQYVEMARRKDDLMRH